MVSGERTGPKNLTIPHADTWVRWELLKINNVRLHYGAGFHQWMGYLRYPLKSETAAVCEEIEKETMLSISNLRHAMYLIFVVAARLFCWGRRCWCCCLILLVCFLFIVICFLFVCLLACLFFFVVMFVLAVVVVFFFRLCANFQLTKCSIKDPQNARGYVTQSLYSVITGLITSPLVLLLEIDKLITILFSKWRFCRYRRRGLFRNDLKLLWYSSKWGIAKAKYKSHINHSKAHRNDLRSLYDVPKSDTLWHNGPTANSIWNNNKKWTRQ